MSNDKLQKRLEGCRVLVTGGAGFFGSEVVRQLSSLGASITVLDNLSSGKAEYVSGLANVRLVRGDVCDSDIVAQIVKDHEFLIHMAALAFVPDSYYYPEQFFKVNTIGTITVMWEAIKANSIRRAVHVSSSEVYGSAKYLPMDENHPTLPHSTYAVSKLAADRAVFSMQREHNFPAAIIRPFNTYGPNVTQPYIVPEIALQLLTSNGHIRLGNAESSRDFTYVSDSARGIVAALVATNVVGETINLGTGKATKIKELVSLMANILGKKVAIELDTSRLRPYDVDTLECDNRKALKLLNWKPEVSLEDGLRKTLEWISKNRIDFKLPFRGWPASYYRNLRHQPEGA